jgi:hypothetical protein
VVASEQAQPAPHGGLADGPGLGPQLRLMVVRELGDLLGMHGGLRSSVPLKSPYDRFRTESVRNKKEITTMSFALVGA